MSKTVVVLREEESATLKDMVLRTKTILSTQMADVKAANDRLFQVLDKIAYNLTTQASGGIFEFDRVMAKELLKIVDTSNLMLNKIKEKYEATAPDKFLAKPKEEYIAEAVKKQEMLKILGEKLEKAING